MTITVLSFATGLVLISGVFNYLLHLPNSIFLLSSESLLAGQSSLFGEMTQLFIPVRSKSLANFFV